MRIDGVVIGAGVIGLAAARALALAGRDVLVLEAHSSIGMETSSRNSEVIHAGMHYRPGSLKARTCLRGREQLYDYCTRKGIAHRRLGKLVVATEPGDTVQLHAIHANALACGVENLEWRDRNELASLEPAVRAEAALWSPDTGIIDSHALMLALQADLEAAGGLVSCNSRVIRGQATPAGVELEVEGATGLRIVAKSVVNAGGLHAARLAGSIAGIDRGSIPRVHLVLGHYFTYGGKSPLNHLVYPLPEAGGLGIHGTLDLAGQLRFGPDSEYVERIDYAFDDSRRGPFAESIQRWLPGLEPERLQAGYTGIRPRLSGPNEGFRDFEISTPDQHGVPGLINLYGIESPGLTACLALAEVVSESVLALR